MTTTETTPASPPAAETTCPTCGAPAQRGQLVCLECGGRIALTYRRPPSWKIPVVITFLVAALVIAGAVVAYQAVADDARREADATPARPRVSPTDTPAKPEAGKTGAGAKAASAPATPGAIVKRGDLYSWPKDLSDFTVVLLSAEDRASATAFARSATTGGDKLGVIRSNGFRTLPKGFYVVFAGQYPTRAKADDAAARLGKRFNGAFAQAVTR
jgi:septal ring-binding cell division protein DamX